MKNIGNIRRNKIDIEKEWCMIYIYIYLPGDTTGTERLED